MSAIPGTHRCTCKGSDACRKILSLFLEGLLVLSVIFPSTEKLRGLHHPCAYSCVYRQAGEGGGSYYTFVEKLKCLLCCRPKGIDPCSVVRLRVTWLSRTTQTCPRRTRARADHTERNMLDYRQTQPQAQWQTGGGALPSASAVASSSYKIDSSTPGPDGALSPSFSDASAALTTATTPWK